MLTAAAFGVGPNRQGPPFANPELQAFYEAEWRRLANSSVLVTEDTAKSLVSSIINTALAAGESVIPQIRAEVEKEAERATKRVLLWGAGGIAAAGVSVWLISLLFRKKSTKLGAVENEEDVPQVIRGEMASAERRARKAGARGAIEFVGAGASGIVFCDRRKRAFKVARGSGDFVEESFVDEADWLRDANKNRMVKKNVAKFFKYHPGLRVIERECVDGRKGNDWQDGEKLYDVWLKFRTEMQPNWRPPEFKSDSFIIRENGTPVLVDAGYVLRSGENLLKHVQKTLQRRRKRMGRSLQDLAYAVRMEVGQTITAAQAQPLLTELRARGVSW